MMWLGTVAQKWSFKAAIASILLALCAPVIAAQPFALKDGETVVFYGDSITAQRLYTKDVEEFVLTRYPQLHVKFVNAGVPGDTAAGGYAGTMAERVARDVAPYGPGMITVMLGMNDGGWGYGSPDQIDADFQSRYNALLHALRQVAPTAALTLISSTPYDEIT
ncbi:MAG: GDSL-type esterase/lipase family protein, partial [Terracidiphilus sp.]